MLNLKNRNDLLFGTKVMNHQTGELGIVIYTWLNKYADKDVEFATCVDKNGKKYNIEMDNITPLE